MDNKTYARCIGKQIQNVQVIFCPRCLEVDAFKQNLCAIGDHEHGLFCPHCELAITIIVGAERND
jgi:hypothetical protein